MGNTATKEQRSSSTSSYPADIFVQRSPLSESAPGSSNRPDENAPTLYNNRHGRGSRSELSQLLGLGRDDRDPSEILESRRESKTEREARRVERERAARERERERSMREESVDGGYLVTQGVYTGVEDFSRPVVRQLMIERRVAPFWRGLNDHSDSWTEHQLVAAARGLPIPPADEAPQEESPPKTSKDGDHHPALSDQDAIVHHLTVPMTSRSLSLASDHSSNGFGHQNFSMPSPSPTSGLLRGRAKTLASLTTSSRNNSSEMVPQETNLPKDSHFRGQPVEAWLYKDASECPICFLYYPPFLNRTRCCDQPICTECFVQIKRPDPHPPEHANPNMPAPQEPSHDPEELVSEPANCPYCAMSELGVTYEPPPLRRGLVYVNQATSSLARNHSSVSSTTSLNSQLASGQVTPGTAGRRRATSLAADAPTVVTIDKVRPDWATKLANVRAHAARRSAAATALHTAAYLMNSREADRRGIGPFVGRGMLRRGTGPESPGGVGEEGAPTMQGPPRGSSRRNRIDDLEEMMMMEAIRQSLAAEEERRAKEEKKAKKEADKEAKKKGKEAKKAEKAARKAGFSPYSQNASQNQSAATLESPQSASFPFDVQDKGKRIVGQGNNGDSDDQMSCSLPTHASPIENPQQHLERSRAHFLSTETSSPYRPSHLRTLSNASSDASSIADPSSAAYSPFEHSPAASGINIARANNPDLQESALSSTPPGGGAGLESMFNFRSLAAMIGEDGEGSGGSEKPSAAYAEHLDAPDVTVTRATPAVERDEGEAMGLEHGQNGLEQSITTIRPSDFSSEARATGETAAPHDEDTIEVAAHSQRRTSDSDHKHQEVHIIDHPHNTQETDGG